MLSYFLLKPQKKHDRELQTMCGKARNMCMRKRITNNIHVGQESCKHHTKSYKQHAQKATNNTQRSTNNRQRRDVKIITM